MTALIEGLGKFFSSFKLTLEWYLATLFILLEGCITGALLLWTNVLHIFRIPTFGQQDYRICGLATLMFFVCTCLYVLLGMGYSVWRIAKHKKETLTAEAELIEELMGL